MKKLLICFTILMFFIGINIVDAESIEFDYTNKYVSYFGNQGFSYIDLEAFYSDYDDYSDKVNELYILLYNSYVDNYQNEYPYYFVSMIPWTNVGSNFIISSDIDDILIHATLYLLKDIPTYSNINNIIDNSICLVAYYSFNSETYITPSIRESGTSLSVDYNKSIFNVYNLDSKYPYVFNPLVYYTSNFNLVFDLDYTYVVKENSNNLYTFNNGDVISTYYESSGVEDNYIEVNLNDYAFIALSLKDYNQESFTSTIQVKGEYCVNAVYDYGLSSKEKYDSSITDVCSPYYDNYTPVRHYVLENDIKNHAIYYIKAHDTSKENKIKVDSSIFNVHYITEEEADNPVININGRDYSILPFDELPTNSIKNTEEGFVPGASEKFSFSDIFTAPLDFLKDIWDSIVSVFDLIKELFSLLPEPIPTFLIISFTLAIVLGLIKIIL